MALAQGKLPNGLVGKKGTKKEWTMKTLPFETGRGKLESEVSAPDGAPPHGAGDSPGLDRAELARIAGLLLVTNFDNRMVKRKELQRPATLIPVLQYLCEEQGDTAAVGRACRVASVFAKQNQSNPAAKRALQQSGIMTLLAEKVLPGSNGPLQPLSSPSSPTLPPCSPEQPPLHPPSPPPWR